MPLLLFQFIGIRPYDSFDKPFSPLSYYKLEEDRQEKVSTRLKGPQEKSLGKGQNDGRGAEDVLLELGFHICLSHIADRPRP